MDRWMRFPAAAAALLALMLATGAMAADPPAAREKTRDVVQVLVLTGWSEMAAPVARPDQQPPVSGAPAWLPLDERLVAAVEKDKGVRVARDSMIKSEKCLQAVFGSITHRVKQAAGLRVTRIALTLRADLSKHSLISPLKSRKLEEPELTVVLHYDRPGAAATRMRFSGYRYH